MLVDRARAAEPAPAAGATVTHRPVPEGFVVARDADGSFRVTGVAVERAVALNDVTTDEAAHYIQGRLRRLGVDRALARAGANDGDVVHIGELSFVWWRDEPSSRRRRAIAPDAVTAEGPAATETGSRPAGGRTVVVKIGSSSVTAGGHLDDAAIDKLAGEVADARVAGDRVVIVTSGAIAAGWTLLADGRPRPTDLATLQAASAVGQHHLMRVWCDALGRRGLVAGQVLLAPLDFVHRSQYLHARQTLERLLDLGVVPVVNENDAVADEEIRFGDNDRLGALVAHLVRADQLVLLTDTAGLLTGDPRRQAGVSLIEEVVEIDHELERIAGGPGSGLGSGGMGSKLAAARIAVWSGIEAVIADAARPGVLAALAGPGPGIGTRFRPHDRRLPARKLWIAFAIGSSGTIDVDDGARRALCERGRSLLPAGVTGVRGDFGVEAAVELAGPDGVVFAKGLVRHPAPIVTRWAGHRSEELPEDMVPEVVHRDDLVVLA